MLVCTSNVCDTGDNRCGIANSDGSCSHDNAAVVCRSEVCDVDGKCGFANSDGTCTSADAASVCRSQVCDSRDSRCGYLVGDGPCSDGSQCRSGSCFDGTCTYSPSEVIPGGSCGTAPGRQDPVPGLALAFGLLVLRRRRR
jgi:hypothetical protein